MVNKILNISLVTKFLEKLDLYAYSIHKCLYIKGILMKTDTFIFQIKKETIKHMEILEKVSNIIKNRFNSELIYRKKYLKAEKENKHKRKLSMFICTNNID